MNHADAEKLLRTFADAYLCLMNTGSNRDIKLVGKLREAVLAAMTRPAGEYVAPIAKVTVVDGKIAASMMYAPGLPDGEHDLYPVAMPLPEPPAESKPSEDVDDCPDCGAFPWEEHLMDCDADEPVESREVPAAEVDEQARRVE